MHDYLVVVHACNPNFQEAEVGMSRVRGLYQLLNENFSSKQTKYPKWKSGLIPAV